MSRHLSYQELIKKIPEDVSLELEIKGESLKIKVEKYITKKNILDEIPLLF